METQKSKLNIKQNLINKVKKRAEKLSGKKQDIYWEALLLETEKLSQQKKVKKIINSKPQSSYC